MNPNAQRDALCRLLERFQGYTLDRVREELDEVQVNALLSYIGDNPTTSTRMVEWK